MKSSDVGHGRLATLLIGGMSPAQGESQDALAPARARANRENQRVLLLLAGGKGDAGQLAKAITDYRSLGKLVRDEYQLAALPASSLAGKTLRRKPGLEDQGLPLLAVLDTKDRLLGKLGAADITDGGDLVTGEVRAFSSRHKS